SRRFCNRDESRTISAITRQRNAVQRHARRTRLPDALSSAGQDPCEILSRKEQFEGDTRRFCTQADGLGQLLARHLTVAAFYARLCRETPAAAKKRVGKRQASLTSPKFRP